MKILITPKELMEKGRWEKFCEITGTNYYGVNEGIINKDEFLELTEEQAEELGLVIIVTIEE